MSNTAVEYVGKTSKVWCRCQKNSKNCSCFKFHGGESILDVTATVTAVIFGMFFPCCMTIIVILKGGTKSRTKKHENLER